MLAEKTARRRIYLDIPVDLVHQLRLSASANRRSVVAEALALLEEALWPDKTTAADAPAGAESYRGAVLYIELTPELLARLQPLADRDYRSVSGEAVVVLQAVLQRHQAKIEEAAAAETASAKRRGRPRSKLELEPHRARRAQRKTAERW
jgi:plasmid stability protein